MNQVLFNIIFHSKLKFLIWSFHDFNCASIGCGTAIHFNKTAKSLQGPCVVLMPLFQHQSPPFLSYFQKLENSIPVIFRMQKIVCIILLLSAALFWEKLIDNLWTIVQKFMKKWQEIYLFQFFGMQCVTALVVFWHVQRQWLHVCCRQACYWWMESQTFDKFGFIIIIWCVIFSMVYQLKLIFWIIFHVLKFLLAVYAST